MIGNWRVIVTGALGGAIGALALVLPFALTTMIGDDYSWSRGQWRAAALFVVSTTVVMAFIARLAARGRLHKGEEEFERVEPPQG